jgi:ribosomal protein L13
MAINQVIKKEDLLVGFQTSRTAEEVISVNISNARFTGKKNTQDFIISQELDCDNSFENEALDYVESLLANI